MSFAVCARHVRDPALPYRRRVAALRSCVQRYCPIGFHASLSFLEELAGPFRRDEAALLRALDALTASRSLWHAELCRYAAVRSAAKHRDQRAPRPGEPNPNALDLYWYGSPRRAALHALGLWRRERGSVDPVGSQLDSCVTACLAAGGPLTPEQRRVATALLATLEDWGPRRAVRLVLIADQPWRSW